MDDTTARTGGAPAATGPGGVPAQPLRILAEIPATVLELGCRPGAEVGVRELLVLLESMKMEIPVHATGAGVVAEVHVAEGDFVRTGDPLVSLRTDPPATGAAGGSGGVSQRPVTAANASTMPSP